MTEKKRRSYEMPEPIPDTPENIARAMLETPPKKTEDWRHVRDRESLRE